MTLDTPYSTSFTFEAEDMGLSGGYHAASGAGEEYIQKWEPDTASATFKGQAGTYSFALDVFDECDGCAEIEVVVDGVVVETTILNEGIVGTRVTGTERTVNIGNTALQTDSAIKLRGTVDWGESARIARLSVTLEALVDPTDPFLYIEIDAGDMNLSPTATGCAAPPMGRSVSKWKPPGSSGAETAMCPAWRRPILPSWRERIRSM